MHVPPHQEREVALGMGMRAELDGTRPLVGSRPCCAGTASS
ncbi:hypothetical protein [Streptomyces sp. Ncost-T10-10d]|nr:hypothetical protein [Streptomyces sp. Ncost-T10-10d]